jgi:hypothetical protein
MKPISAAPSNTFNRLQHPTPAQADRHAPGPGRFTGARSAESGGLSQIPIPKAHHGRVTGRKLGAVIPIET